MMVKPHIQTADKNHFERIVAQSYRVLLHTKYTRILKKLSRG